MLSLALKTALKVSISGAFAYAIAQSFGFNSSFIAPLIAVITTLAGELADWFLLFQLTLAITLAVTLGVIEYYTLGNNYIAIFINVLFAGVLWRYLNTRGLLLAFFIFVIKFASIIIVSSASDKITMAYEMVSTALIGIVIGLLINSLFWSTSSHEQLQKQLSDILENSQQLCDQILNGYLSGNYDDDEAQTLRLTILKTHQSSQVLFKKSLFDITGHQLGKTDWSSILKTEGNLSLHLSALLHLVQTNKRIDLPNQLLIDFRNLIQSFLNCFPELKAAMMDQNVSSNFYESFQQLNRNFIQFHTTLNTPEIRSEIKKNSMSELLCFYSIVHRLEKLVNELNILGIVKIRE